MAVLHPPRARQVCAPKRHKHPILGFGRILAFLAKKNFRQMYLGYLVIILGYESLTPVESVIDISSLKAKLGNFSDILLEKLKMFR